MKIRKTKSKIIFWSPKASKPVGRRESQEKEEEEKEEEGGGGEEDQGMYVLELSVF